MGVDGMANEEQAPPKAKSAIEWWGDIDAQMANVKAREAATTQVLGMDLHTVHNATGPWYAYESPTHEWFESDKVFWAYDFHTDDLFGTIFGNPLSQFIIGAVMGARQPTMATEQAMANASITYANDAVRKVEEAELEGLNKPPKKTPMVLAYKTKMEQEDGTVIDVNAYKFIDFPKEGILPGAYPGMMEGAMGAGGTYGKDCDEECEFVQDLSKKVQELEAYAGVPGTEA